ncbi:hypothetical protein QCA50_007172 [Cerrena zonata]|uniref:Uncharacterized protein n=1 Tax=Cerrena zonata TaxID=2478898 RepID=A0AAW0GJX8_9APHY
MATISPAQPTYVELSSSLSSSSTVSQSIRSSFFLTPSATIFPSPSTSGGRTLATTIFPLPSLSRGSQTAASSPIQHHPLGTADTIAITFGVAAFALVVILGLILYRLTKRNSQILRIIRGWAIDQRGGSNDHAIHTSETRQGNDASRIITRGSPEVEKSREVDYGHYLGTHQESSTTDSDQPLTSRTYHNAQSRSALSDQHTLHPSPLGNDVANFGEDLITRQPSFSDSYTTTSTRTQPPRYCKNVAPDEVRVAGGPLTIGSNSSSSDISFSSPV